LTFSTNSRLARKEVAKDKRSNSFCGSIGKDENQFNKTGTSRTKVIQVSQNRPILEEFWQKTLENHSLKKCQSVRHMCALFIGRFKV